MKKLSRILSLVLALALAAVSLSVTAIADVSHDGSSSITISGVPTDDTSYFKVFQIFAGDSDGDVLSNITWGSSLRTVGQQALITALNDYFSGTSGYTDLDTDATAAEVAAVMGNITSEIDLRTIMMGIFGDSNNIVSDQKSSGVTGITWTAVDDQSGNGTYAHSTDDITDGYYFIVGNSNSVDKDAIVVAVVGNTVASEKTINAVSVSKDVKASGGSKNYTYGVGDEVTFEITVTLPSSLSAYSTYYIGITDTLTGLTVDSPSSAISGVLKDSSGNYTETLSITDGDLTGGLLTFSVTLDPSAGINFTTYAGGTVTFTYTAKITDESYLSSTNTAYATYSSNPNDLTETDDTDPTDPVQLYTVSVKVNKTDGNDPLGGAFFTLTNDDTGDVSKTRTSNTDDDNANNIITAADDNVKSFYFVGLGKGTYTLSEETTPSGYNTTGDYTITVNADGTVKVIDADGNETEYSVDYLTNSASETGVVEFTVVNNAGQTLPETGGMGTKIFYTLGGILVVGAGILLIVKRRMRTA